jgi:hypothetical protein
MKVRLEITDDDGTTHVNVEFTGDEWQKCLVSFIESFTGKKIQACGPSSASGANSHNSNISQQPVSQPIQQTFSHPYPHSPPIQMNAMPNQPVMQPVAQAFIPPQQPLIYQYPLYLQSQYPQYVQTVPANYNNFQPSQVLQYTVQSQSSDQLHLKQSVPVNMPVNNTPPQAAQHSQLIQVHTPPAHKTLSFHEKIGDTNLTISERLELFLKYEYPRIWFSSQDIQKHYEKIYGPIKLSTVSTYLSRMFSKNLLERRGNRTQREYRYIFDETVDFQAAQSIPNHNMI